MRSPVPSPRTIWSQHLMQLHFPCYLYSIIKVGTVYGIHDTADALDSTLTGDCVLFLIQSYQTYWTPEMTSPPSPE